MDFGSSSSSSRFPFENRRHFEQQQELEQQQQQQEDQEIMECNNSIFVEKEHMFDKVVTPSDVGKLNRLVIPKQHAEKYFPLDSSSNEKGLLLNFEDRSGKSWRFRYSYWTSSQSYVMTKGWSRFVKEKRLDAGDIVSFQRGVGDVGKDRFFIDWRRRPPHAAVETAINFHHHGGGGGGGGQIPHHFQVHQWATPLSLHRDHVLHLPQNNSNHNNVSLFHNTNNPYWNNHHYPHHHHRHHRPNHPVVGGGGSYGEPSVFYHLRSATTVTASEVVPVAAGGGGGHGIIGKGAAAKTLRLFGVDMECAVSEESDDECDITTSTTTMSSSSPQFRIYNGMPMSMPMPVSMSMSMQMQMQNDNNNVPTTDFFEKGKSSMSSLDFGT